QRARRVKRAPPALFPGQRFEPGVLSFDHFADVARHRADFLRLPGVRRVVPEQVRVFLHHHPAAARGHDDGLDLAAFYHRPPAVDQRAHVGKALFLVADMEAQRAAAAGAFRFEDRNADSVEQAPVLHARRAGRLAGAAGETAVEVQASLVGDLLPLEHLLHEVDATARAIVLVAEEQIGRTGRGAETAVHALAQDGVGFAPFG